MQNKNKQKDKEEEEEEMKKRGGRAPVLDGYQHQIPASQGEKISDLCSYEHGLKCPEQNTNFKLNESMLCILSWISSVWLFATPL